MNASHADRNLLFGILALQMDFIDRDALVSAMNAWVLEKSKPLGQVMLEQGKIKPDEQKLLEALVVKHLEKHGNDAEKSLAALSGVGDITEELKRIADPDISASLRHVTIPSQPDDAYVTQRPVTGGGSVLRFQILRPHAKGGLGQVSVAEDTELHREVALKEIQPAFAGDMHSRSRFLLEAEITGGLEHPGIVPVYGLGHYEDGRPYYAMRFIRGDSLKEAIDRFYKQAPGRSASDTALEMRKLIGRLIDVCNAIEYAHSRGVLHRDLKPGNIMLGKYGETLVVDWGLAKPLDQPETVRISEEGSLRPMSISASAPTILGTAVGTPQFMSPEQAAGRMQMLGPYSDVYSLGATLYAILTGKPPFDERDIGTVLQRVQRGDFDKPRQVNKDIPKPLEAICLKAMALQPQDRYQSPGQMADELEHWLADEPVKAYPESASERAGRWVRRHRTLALAAAAALLAITGASLVAAALINQARMREAIARRDAETSFQLARKAVDDFFTNVSESTLLDVPGLQPLRKDLLQIALGYDQEFLKQRGNDPSLRQEAAGAEFRIGTVIGEIGSKTEALEHFKRAREIQQALVDADPSNPALRFALADTINAMGGIEQAINALPDAKKHFDEGRQMREKLVGEQPDNSEYQRKLANSYSNLGVIERAEGRFDKAVPWYSKANHIRAQVVVKDPKNELFVRDLARGYYNLGAVQREADKLDEAAENFKKAIGHFTQLAEEIPLKIEYRRELGITHKVLGDLRSHTDRFQDAQECYERARGIQQPLAHDNPVLVNLAADLAGTFIGLGDLKKLQGELAEASRLHEEAGAILRQLVRENPTVTRFQQDVASQQIHFGLVQIDAGDNEKAHTSFDEARDIYERLLKEDQANSAYERGLAKVHSNLAYVAFLQGNYDDALSHYGQAHDSYTRLAGRTPDDARLQDDLGFTLGRLAGTEFNRGNMEAALELYGQAQKIHERWLEGPAATLEHRQHLAECFYGVSMIRVQSEQWSEAVTALQRAAELYGSLLIHHPKNVGFRTLRAACFRDLGYPLWKLDRGDEERQAYREAVEEQRIAFELKPQDIVNRQALSRYLADRAAVERDTGHIDEAVAACLERQKLWSKDPAALYSVARDLALVAAAVEEGSKREKVADQAVEILREAGRAGFQNWQQAETDEDLNILRDRPGYKTLVKKE